MAVEQQAVGLRPGEEEKIRQAVRVAILSCRGCKEGTNCVGALLDLFHYLSPEVKRIVDDEQAQVLEQIIGGD